MPTSHEEAQKIVEILDEYVSLDHAKELTARLEQEVGQETDNDSLKVSLEMLKSIYTPPVSPKNYDKKALLSCVVVLHMVVVAINCASFFVLPFMYSVWIWVPLNSFILNVTFAPPGACPLTRLENKLRTSLDMPRIGGFLGHYVIRPIKRKLRGKSS